MGYNNQKNEKGLAMICDLVSIGGLIAGLLSIIVGIIIIVWPRVITYVIGGYLIAVGVIAVIAALQ